jgi:hypothetical protein
MAVLDILLWRKSAKEPAPGGTIGKAGGLGHQRQIHRYARRAPEALALAESPKKARNLIGWKTLQTLKRGCQGGCAGKAMDPSLRLQDRQKSGDGPVKRLQDRQKSGDGPVTRLQDRQKSGDGPVKRLQDRQKSGNGPVKRLQDRQKSGDGPVKRLQNCLKVR